MSRIDGNTTLDVLHRARASLVEGPFSFHDWTECTCGHLFTAAHGAGATSRGEVRSPRPDTPYASAVVAVALALSGDERRFAPRRRWLDRRSRPRLAVRWISDRTMARARARQDVVRRADAIAVIDEAISRIRRESMPLRPALGDIHERQLVA
jgi:hypothetical protein